MGRTTTAAAALVAQITPYLPEGALATIDPDAAARAANSGHGAVVVRAPVLTWGGVQAGHAVDVTWALALITRLDTLPAAWDRLDELLDAVLAAGVDVATARPGTSPNTTGGDAFPAYLLTLDPTLED
jgi:hypothetical protein